MRYRIAYQSRVEFGEPVSEQQGELRLIPRTENYQKVISYTTRLNPEVTPHEYQDAFGNQVQFFNVIPPHSSWEVHFEAEVENELKNPFDFIPPAPVEEFGAIGRLLKEQPRYFDYVLANGPIIPSRDRLPAIPGWPECDPKKNLIESIQGAIQWIRS